MDCTDTVNIYKAIGIGEEKETCRNHEVKNEAEMDHFIFLKWQAMNKDDTILQW